MNNPKVSVMVPTYNQEDLIKETLDSILSQTYRNIEVIVTDDGSSDRTSEIINAYHDAHPDRIKPVYSDVNTGIAANVNRALAQVTGKYISWLAGDDLMKPEKIEKQVCLLESRLDAVGCIHDVEVFESGTGKVYGLFSDIYNGSSKFDSGGVELWFRSGYCMPGLSLMIRASSVPANLYDTRLHYLNEWVFHVEVFRQGKCLVLDEVLGGYRRHAGNVTSSDRLNKIALEENLIALGIVESRYPELYRHIKSKRQALLLGAAYRCYLKKDKKLFFHFLKAAISVGGVVRAITILIRRMYYKRSSDSICF